MQRDSKASRLLAKLGVDDALSLALSSGSVGRAG